MNLEFKLSSQVPDSDFNALCEILNKNWSHLKVTPEIMKKRFASGSLFLITYYENKPCGILETIALKTNRNLTLIPNNYNLLTNNGNWLPQAMNADTLILVDITIDQSFAGKGLGSKIIEHSLNYLAENTIYQYIFTYTPNEPNVIAWHMKNGAKDSRYNIQKARVGHKVEDVIVMDYSPKIKELRDLS